jgi:hypothetical protein
MLMPNFIRGRHGCIKFASGVEEIKMFQPGRQGPGGILYRTDVEIMPLLHMQCKRTKLEKVTTAWNECWMVSIVAYFTSESFVLKVLLLVSWLIYQLTVLH